MDGSFAIAYSDKDGSGYTKAAPWVLDEYGDDIEKCLEKAKKMMLEGYQDVVVFQFGKRIQEEVSWEYVKQRTVNKLGRHTKI